MTLSQIISIVFLVLVILIVSKVVWDITKGRNSNNRPFVAIYPDSIRIVYENDEPYFNDGNKYAKKLDLSFWKYHEKLVYQAVLILRKSNDGWITCLEEKSAFEVTSSAFFKRKPLQQLTKNINEALKRGRSFNFVDIFKGWEISAEEPFDEFRCSLLPNLGRISPLPENIAHDDVVLTYQDGQPIFYQDNQIGRWLNLDFGECTIGDGFRSVLSCSVALKQDKQGWNVVLLNTSECDYGDWYSSPFISTQEEYVRYDPAIAKFYLGFLPNVSRMIENCNHAIANGQPVNLREFKQQCENFDKYFEMYVPSNTLFV